MWKWGGVWAESKKSLSEKTEVVKKGGRGVSVFLLKVKKQFFYASPKITMHLIIGIIRLKHGDGCIIHLRTQNHSDRWPLIWLPVKHGEETSTSIQLGFSHNPQKPLDLPKVVEAGEDLLLCEENIFHWAVTCLQVAGASSDNAAIQARPASQQTRHWVIRDGWQYQIGRIFGKAPKIYIADFGPLYRVLNRAFQGKLQYNFLKIRGGSMAVSNFSENSSDLVASSVPNHSMPCLLCKQYLFI